MAARQPARASPELRKAPLSPRYLQNYTTPRGTTLLWQLGWTYWQNNQCEEGVVAMREMSNPPEESFKNLAGLYACAGEIEKSRNAMVRFLESSEDYSILDEQAKTHQIRSEEDTAVRWLDHLRVAGVPEN